MTTTSLLRQALTSDRLFQTLKDYVITETGLVYYATRDAEFATCLGQRFSKLCLDNCSSYLRLLQSGTAGGVELDCLIEKLTIGETFFFRHRELFNALQGTVIPDLIERNGGHRGLRIWSAGCSIGAEAYSVSILLQRHFGEQLRDWEISIVGTDINREFLSRATQGVFEEWALRAIADDERHEYFTEQDKHWTIKPCFKEGVSFQYHNLASHPYPSLLHNLCAFDIILCRNVIIYFSGDLIRTTIGKFHNCLVDGGWLLTGHAEYNTELFGDFRTVNCQGATVYQRNDGQVAAADQPVTALPSWIKPVEAQSARSWSDIQRPAALDVSPKTAPKTRQRRPPSTDLPRNGDSVSQLENIRDLADRGEVVKAADQCDRLLATNQFNPVFHLYHALILEQMGQHEQVERSLRRAIYLDRTFVLAHYYLGMTLKRFGQPAQAARSLQNVLDLLCRRDPDQVVDDSDGLSVAELEKLTHMQLDTIEV